MPTNDAGYCILNLSFGFRYILGMTSCSVSIASAASDCIVARFILIRLTVREVLHDFQSVYKSALFWSRDLSCSNRLLAVRSNRSFSLR
jgi:hypothetical protein